MIQAAAAAAQRIPRLLAIVLSAYLLPAWLLLYVLKARYPIKTIARSLAILCAAAAAAWIMSSCQIIPAMLFFDKAVTTRTPELAEYLNTYPRPHEILLAGAGLFTRTFRSLFLPFSLLLLVLCGLFRKRRNPAVFASLVLGGLALIMVIGGRWGLGSIPFSLPMLKSFIRHYRLGLALQAPLLIIAAVGFDELILCLQEPSRRWKILGLLCLALTLPMAGSIAFAALLAAVSAYVVFAVYRKRTNYLALAVFALIALDLAGFAWKTPYPLNLPDYDPVYEKYVEKLGHKGRVQGMYPWTARAGSKFDHPLPVHGTGYKGESSIESWFQYPLTNHAYFLAAICPEVAEISGGVFSNLDFSTCFKSTDFVNESNRDLVNLAAIRYFFLQDFALEEADLYPLLSDPRYLANPARPGAFQPFKRLPQGTYKLKEVKKTFGSSRPVLEASKPGLFTYERTVEPQTVLETYLAWLPRSLATTAKEKCRPDRKTGNALHPRAKSGSWGILTYEAQGSLQLLQARAADAGSKGRIKTKGALLPSSEQKAKLQFIHFPATGPGKEAVFYWIDPRLWNHANSIKYREGKRVMVYENFESMGRTRIVHQARRAPNNEKALEMMRSSEYNPSAETIVMSGRAPLLEGPAPYREEHSRIVEQFQDEVVVKANLSKKGYLVLADTYYPGWRAYNEEGEELVIHRADLNLKAVFLSEGTSTVRFVFQPVHVRVGIFVTISSLLFLVMAVSIRGLIKRKKG
ncbi:MAG: hypothetical protein R6V10_12665 [bacterium]